ncbi:hypothetical protein [Robiginitalea sp. SC105]|uniref:hypothetical protein n=1 Tax=Robiginitalea sp. SC105 TaxID=2762332 RepID=UPI00163A41D9|nr:hypothetical protein [Robiginitalea sp. SC105]MBC2840121.1 hypothetical protein [Robiginitalea sp. SC105]
MTALILFQSCVVYHKTPVSLNKAVDAGSKSKVVNELGVDFEFEQIVEEDGSYYGFQKKSGQRVKTLIDNGPETSVFLKNKRASNWATLLVVGLPVVGLWWGFVDFISDYN